MSKRREKRTVRDGAGTMSLAEAAAQLGVPVAALVEAIEESGIEPARDGQELRLEVAEIEKYKRLVAKGRSETQERLAALLEETG